MQILKTSRGHAHKFRLFASFQSILGKGFAVSVNSLNEIPTPSSCTPRQSGTRHYAEGQLFIDNAALDLAYQAYRRRYRLLSAGRFIVVRSTWTPLINRWCISFELFVPVYRTLSIPQSCHTIVQTPPSSDVIYTEPDASSLVCGQWESRVALKRRIPDAIGSPKLTYVVEVTDQLRIQRKNLMIHEVAVY